MTIPKSTVPFLYLLLQSVYFFYFSSCYSVFLTHFQLWMSWVFLFNLQICNATVSSVYIHFQVSMQNYEKQLFVLSCLSVRPRGTIWLPLNRIPWNLILSIFCKSVQKIPVWLKYDKNNGYFTRRHMYIYDIALSYSQNEKYFRQKFVGKIETHILCSLTLFENLAVYEIMWKNIVQLDRPQITI